MNEGEYINPAMGGMGPGGGSVVTLMDLSEVKIEVQVSERDVGKIRVGQDARVTVDAYPGKMFRGNVSNVHPAAHPMSRTFKVEIAVVNPDLILKAGTDAGVKLSIEVRQGALLVPEKSVLEQAGACFLFVAEGDTARRREVKTGLRGEGLVEIIEGVREGETVIGEGNYGLKDGAKVAW
jgi:RND family efflux transporter MFP subunit